MIDITFVYDYEGDWVALYKNGELLDQGHSFTPESVLKMIGIQCTSFEADASKTRYQFPMQLKDVKK